MDLAGLIVSTLQARARHVRLVAYVARQAALGRHLAQVLEDPYVVNRTSAGERGRLLEDPTLIVAWHAAIRRQLATAAEELAELVPVRGAVEPERPLRILVVANETCASEALLNEVRYRGRGGHAEVLIVAPLRVAGTPDRARDLDAARVEAQARLDAAASALREVGVAARGEVGDVDSLAALDDALSRFDADEVIIATHPHHRSRWVEQRMIQRARERHALPITHLVADVEFERWEDEGGALPEREGVEPVQTIESALGRNPSQRAGGEF